MDKEKSDPAPLPDLDEALRRTRQGDRVAREQLFGQLRAEARRRAGGQLGARQPGGANASDLAQEAMVRMVEHLPGLRGQSSGQLRAYLRRTGDNTLKQQVRDAGRQRRDEHLTVSLEEAGSGPRDPAPGPETRIEDKQRRQLFLGRLSQLPGAQRLALWRHYEGASVAAIAAELGKTEKAAASLLERAVRTLRRDLGASCPPPAAALRRAFLGYLRACERGEVRDREAWLAQAGDPAGLRELLDGLSWVEEQIRQEEQAP